MCGILGYVGEKKAIDILVPGLKFLEYRGYDSSGIAISFNEKITIEKTVGPIDILKEKVKNLNSPGNLGIAHTRWATHGKASLENAHPHFYKDVYVVHNGIIENHEDIRKRFLNNGHVFLSETDTETLAHLFDDLLKNNDPMEALKKLKTKISGSYAILFILSFDPSRIFFLKKGPPLLIAKDKNEAFLASDRAALASHVDECYSIKDDEWGYISHDGIKVYNSKSEEVNVQFSKIESHFASYSKDGFPHFMLKEIFEQEEIINRVLLGRIIEDHEINPKDFNIDFSKIRDIKKIHVIACGSSYLSGLIAKASIESLVKIPVHVEIASEYRYKETLTDSETLVIAISQSGETADTLAALVKAINEGAKCLSLCNVSSSSIAILGQNSLGNIPLRAGLEISVASTKALLAQLLTIKLLALSLAKYFKLISNADEHILVNALINLKSEVKECLSLNEQIKDIAKDLLDTKRVIYLGRGELSTIAYEGALKMKEISYISADAYPAGELKHGPIATIEPGVFAVVLFGNDLKEKTLSSLHEVKARGANIISIALGDLDEAKKNSKHFIKLPPSHAFTESIISTIPLQLLSYHLASLKGLDIDKPRNLAKSVTVE